MSIVPSFSHSLLLSVSLALPHLYTMVAQGFITPAPPANPTTQGRQEVPIAPVSNWAVGNVSSVLVFPSTLDPARLEAAFARAASFWPSVVGRYVKATVPGGPEFAVSEQEGNEETREGAS